MNIGTRLANAIALNVVRPWALNDLPGWGPLVKLFVEKRGDEPWRDTEPVWGRGTLHGYEMLLDLSCWSSRTAYFTGRYYDVPTQLLLKKLLRPGDTFVDIGAHEGMISLLASRLVGPTGTVVAFEPNPIPRKFFAQALARNDISNIVLESYGVGAEPATLILHVPKINSGEGTFGTPDPQSGETYEVECAIRPADPVLVDCSPSLIKIDVEGFEIEALQGIRKTLDRVKPPVIMELIGPHLHRAGTSVREVRDFMESRGYQAYGIDWGLTLEPVDLHEEMHTDVLWSGPA